MTRRETILERFLSKPSDFTFAEMKKLLHGFGYHEVKTGKSSGSRVAFINDEKHHIIRLHKPHPQKVIKRYQLDLIEEELKKQELLR